MRNVKNENQCYKKPYSALLSNLKGDSLAAEAGKTQKMTKIIKKLEKLQKLVSFCVFVVPKHIAHKMVITSNFGSQNAFINF